GAVDVGQHALVVGRVYDHAHAAFRRAVILGGGAQHGGTADVDVLDGVGKGAAGLGDGLAERIEVDDQQIDAIDAVLFNGLQVFGAVAAGQQAAVDLGMQRLDAAVQDLGRAGVLGHFGDVQAGLRQQLGGAAGGQEAHAALGQRLGEFDNTGFVGDRKKSCLDFYGR